LINPLGSANQITNLANDSLLQETILKVRKESKDEAFDLGKHIVRMNSTLYFYKNNFIRTRSSFLLKI